MPTSEKQKGAAGAAYGAVKKGSTAVNKLKGPAKSMAKSMSKSELKKMATGPIKKESVKESVEENHMMGQEYPGYEDKVGQICIVMKPTPESSPEELVQTTNAFGMGQYDPTMVHGIYNDEKEANLVAEAICNELQQHLAEVEKKKGMVAEKLEAAIKGLQKEVNRCMEEGNDMRAQQTIQKIAELRNKHQMVEASKKEIKKEEE
jgi:hypothetical protein